jgi:hypothetical protein
MGAQPTPETEIGEEPVLIPSEQIHSPVHLPAEFFILDPAERTSFAIPYHQRDLRLLVKYSKKG